MQRKIIFIVIGVSAIVVAKPMIEFFQITLQSDSQHRLIIIEDGGMAYTTMMRLNRERWRYHIYAKENTLNDTSALCQGYYHLPPGKTGFLYSNDCHSDSLPFDYKPYRATKGRLVIEYRTTRI